MRNIQLAFVALAALGLGIMVAVALRHPTALELQSGIYLSQPRPIPDFTLTDHNQTTFDQSRLQGHWNLLFAGFTRCPDFCPNTLALLKAVREQLGAKAEQLQVIFFSVDPERDTPAKIKPYVEYFDPSFIGITGSTDEVGHLARALGLAFTKVDQGETGAYTIDHSVALVLINPEGQIAAYFSTPHTLAGLSSDLASIMAYPR